MTVICLCPNDRTRAPDLCTLFYKAAQPGRGWSLHTASTTVRLQPATPPASSQVFWPLGKWTDSPGFPARTSDLEPLVLEAV